jgi:hypothetical protein
MIFMIVFGLLFLVGISLFATFVGTALLKKNARVVRVPSRPGHRAGPAPYRAYPGRSSVDERSPREQRYEGFQQGSATGEQYGDSRSDAAPEEEQPGEVHHGSAAEQIDYRAHYREEYQEDLDELRRAESEREARENPAAEGRASQGEPFSRYPQQPMPSSSKRSGGGAGLWILVAVLVVVIFSGSLYATIQDWPSRLFGTRMYFCEYVDYAKLKPVNRSDTFTRGNLTLFVKSPQPLRLHRARIEVYRLGNQQEPYAEKIVPLKPSWMSFAVKLLFEDIGNYRVSVLESDGTPIMVDHLTIVPDSFAYRPVPVVKE